MSNRTLRNVLYQTIDKLELVVDTPYGLTQSDRKLIRHCLEREVITKFEFQEQLHQRLLVLGRENYCRLFIPGRYPNPDRAPSVVSFAYALEHGEITDKELDKVKFDFNDTKETFMLKERKMLLEKTMNRLVQ